MNDQITGRTRLRVQRLGLFGRRIALVLQVHVSWKDGPGDSDGMPSYLAGEGWRDAQVEDLASLERLGIQKPHLTR
jgi:hypothetical protein